MAAGSKNIFPMTKTTYMTSNSRFHSRGLGNKRKRLLPIKLTTNLFMYDAVDGGLQGSFYTLILRVS